MKQHRWLVALKEEDDEDSGAGGGVWVVFQEAQQRQEQWEEDATQMLREKERAFNNIGCRKTLNFDKLSELSGAVSWDPGAPQGVKSRLITRTMWIRSWRCRRW